MTSQIIHLTKTFLIKLQSLPLAQQQQAIDFCGISGSKVYLIGSSSAAA